MASTSGHVAWGKGFYRLDADIVASNPAHGMDLCPHHSVLCSVSVLPTYHELIPAGCTRPWCSAEGVQSMQLDGRLSIGKR
jgi:hypothetical protein